MKYFMIMYLLMLKMLRYLLPILLFWLEKTHFLFCYQKLYNHCEIDMEQLNHDDTMDRWIKDFKQQHVPSLLQRYQILYHQLNGVPQSLVLKLSELPWFVMTVAKTHSNINASEFIVFFLKAACSLVAENPKDTSNVQNMIHDILEHIRLHNETVDVILSDILTCDFFKNENSAMNAKNFLARFYQIFELNYPENFDKHLKNLMKQNDERSKLALYFLISWPFINMQPSRCWAN